MRSGRGNRCRAASRVDAVVVGGGPAGCLAAACLQATGRRVVLLNRLRTAQPAGAGAHVHRIPSASWQGLEALLPGFRQAVVEAGAVEGRLACQSSVDCDDAEPTPWLSRPLLDRAMRRRVKSAGVLVKDSCALQVTAPGKREWEVDYQLAGGRSSVARLRASLMIDASGSARAALGGVAVALGMPIPLLQVPGRDTYCSMRMTGVSLPPDAGALSLGDASTGRMIIQRLESSPEDGATHLLTLIARAGNHRVRAVNRTDIDLHGLVREDVRCAAVLERARPVTASLRFGPLPIQLLQMHRVAPAAPGWLAIGDALLVTSPAKGLGISWAVLQAERLRKGLSDGLQSDELRCSLGELAEAAWLRASFAEALEDDGFHPDNSFDPERDQNQESCHA